MELVSSVWHVISALIVFMTGIVVALLMRKPFKIGMGRSSLIYAWHTIFCFVYVFFVINNGGDAGVYYIKSLASHVEFELGTSGVVLLTSLFSVVFGLSLLGAFLVYNIFGFIGLLAFDASLRFATADKSKNIRRLATLIVFLPSVSFWSSAIGKDSLSFMSAGLALWAALNLNRRFLLMVFAVLVMLFVRPHMAGMMVLALTFSMLIQAKVPLGQRLLMGSIGLVSIPVLVPFALNYAGISKGADLGGVYDYIQMRQGHNMDGAGGIDIASMSLPSQLFSYLFRPLPFEAHNVFAFAASVDNTILLFLSLIGGLALIKRRRQVFGGNRIFLWLYILMAWAVLATTTANSGISVRQKWMFAPMLIYLFISVIGRPCRKVVHAQAFSKKLLVKE